MFAFSHILEYNYTPFIIVLQVDMYQIDDDHLSIVTYLTNKSDLYQKILPSLTLYVNFQSLKRFSSFECLNDIQNLWIICMWYIFIILWYQYIIFV